MPSTKENDDDEDDDDVDEDDDIIFISVLIVTKGFQSGQNVSRMFPSIPSVEWCHLAEV